MFATSSTVNALLASFFGSTLNSRTTPFAVAFSARMTGRSTVAKNTSGGASNSAARSGTENERFLGTISPNTTCRNDTITSAMTKAIVAVAASDSPIRVSGISRTWWMAGSDTFRISSEQTVMPSWLVANISVACSIAHSVVFAAPWPASARGSIWDRRAEITANSAATKKAFTMSRMPSHAMPHQSFIARAPRRAPMARFRARSE